MKLIKITFLLLILSCISLYAVSEERFLLGTVCKITIYDTTLDEDTSYGLISDAFDLIEDIENRMSANHINPLHTNMWQNEVLQINSLAGKRPVAVSDDTLYLVEKSIEYSEISGGKFDITIGPVIKLWNIGTSLARVPGEDEIMNKLQYVDYRNIEIDADKNTVFLKEAGMMIDLGGIAKGFAGDRVKEYFVNNGVEHAIINLGGNVLDIGRHPDDRPWKIGVQNPFAPTGTVMAVIDSENEAVVTSGNYERYFIEDGVRYHHILDTKTGYPVVNSLAGVSIITDNSTKADALSTAVFAMGYAEGMSLIEKLPDVEAVFITKNKQVYMSSGIEDRFSLTDDDFIILQSP